MELNKAQLTGVISLMMILGGTVAVNSIKDTYYCEGEESVKECLRLSPSNQTCYWADLDLKETRDLCSGGTWNPITNYISFPVVSDKGLQFNVTRPIIMTNAKITKDLGNVKYIEGTCYSKIQ